MTKYSSRLFSNTCVYFCALMLPSITRFALPSMENSHPHQSSSQILSRKGCLLKIMPMILRAIRFILIEFFIITKTFLFPILKILKSCGTVSCLSRLTQQPATSKTIQLWWITSWFILAIGVCFLQIV